MILTPSAKYFWSQTFHFCYRNYLASLQHFDYWKFLVTPPHLWPVWSYAYSPRRYSSVWHSSFEPSVASLLLTLSYSPLLPTQPCRCFPMITSSISLHSPPQTPVPLAPKMMTVFTRCWAQFFHEKNLVVFYPFLINLPSYYCFLNSVIGGVSKDNWRDKHSRNTGVTNMVLLRMLHVWSMNFNLS